MFEIIDTDELTRTQTAAAVVDWAREALVSDRPMLTHGWANLDPTSP